MQPLQCGIQIFFHFVKSPQTFTCTWIIVLPPNVFITWKVYSYLFLNLLDRLPGCYYQNIPCAQMLGASSQKKVNPSCGNQPYHHHNKDSAMFQMWHYFCKHFSVMNFKVVFYRITCKKRVIKLGVFYLI